MTSIPSRLRLASHALAQIAELGGDENPVPLAPEGDAEKLFALSVTVAIGGVEEIDPEIERAIEGSERFHAFGCAMVERQTQAAEADRRHARAVRPELALLH